MKQLVIVLLMCMAGANVLAQIPDIGQYEVKFDALVKDGVDNHSGSCTNRFDMYTTIDGVEQNSWPVDLNPIGTFWKIDIPIKTMTLGSSQKLTKLKFRGERNWKNAFNCNGNDGWDEIDLSYDGCYKEVIPDKIPYWVSLVSVSVLPKAINLFYFDRAAQYQTNSAIYYLPQVQKIQIKATSGFPSSVYGWQYQIGAGAWTNFPTSLYSNNQLSFSGNDLTGVDFINDVLVPNNNIKVRISYGCGGYSSTMVLIPLLSAPEILDVYPEAPSCSYFDDGKLTVKFSRALYAGETISFTLATLPQSPQNISAFDAGNTFTLTGYPWFTDRVLSLVGRFNSNFTYTDDPVAHNKLVSVPRTLPINFTATPFNVHCNDGEDGRIDVTAEEGSKSYTSYLELAGNPVQNINLTSTSGNSFTNLKAGGYIVTLKDSHGCDTRDGNAPYLDAKITQPTQKVSLSTVENVEPLGFGLQNGHITVRSENGTYPYTFDWTDINNTPRSADAPVTEGSSMISTLGSIGKGTYHVLARDGNYSLAFPQTEVNLKGCYDELTIEMDEPPLLEVFIEEDHFVSCYKYSDGELVAHAKGGRPYSPTDLYHPYLYEWFTVNGSVLTPFATSDSIVTDRPSDLYRIKVTDRNGIPAWSQDFTLVQPDALKINFVTSELLCNGDMNGTSTAVVQGGTAAYRYAWSTNDQTSQINNLADGWYSIIVTDSRECTTYGQTEVKVPNGLKTEAILDELTCKGYTDGGVELITTGGHAPYVYVWDHGANTAIVTQLAKGEYHVKITDANGCFITGDYSLEDPELFPVSLGPDRVLCKEQSLDLNVSMTDPFAQYQWSKNGVAFASTPKVQLTDAGIYQLKITDSNSCSNDDEIKIERNDSEIAANIIVATRVPVSGKVRVANISYPAADRVEWIVPQGATMLEETSGYLDISFDTKGEYSVGLTSFRGACEKTVFSPVRVVDKSELTDYQAPLEPYIKQFMVTPNPNDGSFIANVELREIGDFALTLNSAQGIFITRQEVKQQSTARIEFNVSSQVGSGVYVLQLATSQGYSTFKVVIQK